MIKDNLQKPKVRIGRPPRHGAYSLMIRAGELPKRRTYLRAYLTEVRDGLIRDLGPTEADLTTAQRIIINSLIGKLSVLRCIEEQVREEGVFRGHELSPVLARSYVTYAEALRRDLQTLGIDRKRADETLDLGRYVETKYGKAKPASSDKGGSEIVQPGANVSDKDGKE